VTHLDVAGVGYTNASQMLGDANRLAAVAVAALNSALADGGAMAGDSSFASEFATAYDEGAMAVVGGFVDVVDALASLCRVTYCSLENHYRAELASVASTTFSTEPDAASHDLFTAVAMNPPSSLGGDAGFLPGWANVILDHVEGFVWPDADLERLRSTADAWRKAAAQIDYVVDLTGDAICELWEERSPEIPLATHTIGELRMGVRELAAACEQLATACDDYAAAVETQRELILDLVSDLIRDAVLIQAAGFVLGFVTGGSTNAVAMWINSGKLASQVPRFKAFVEAVRLAGASAATTMRTGTEAVVQVRNKLSKFRNVAPIRTWGHSAVVDSGALARVRAVLGDPKRLDPQMFRGMSRREVRELVEHWPSRPSKNGIGTVFDDPVNKGRQIRIMQGYPRSSRPDILVTGDYVVVSQNSRVTKVALEGNPTL
jgi:hypothetical protein